MQTVGVFEAKTHFSAFLSLKDLSRGHSLKSDWKKLRDEGRH